MTTALDKHITVAVFQKLKEDQGEVFGHNSMDGSKLADPNGRRFSLAGRGSSSSGR